jgi:hypothetical protein
VDKTKLFEDRMPRAEVEVPGFGTVTVRAMSRYEQMLIGKTAGGDPIVFERKTLALTLVDPELSEDEVERWQKSAPAGEMSDILKTVNRLSGLDKEAKEAQKTAFEAFRGGPES